MRNYRGEFEVHVTVRVSGTKLAEFRAWCQTRECKCAGIVLARGDHVEQPMATWRRSNAILSEVIGEARQRAAELEHAELPVVRVKVEADPHNDEVPEHDPDDSGNYFEHHVKLIRDAAANVEPLLQACVKHGAHLSRNAWRQAAHGQEERFVTLRCHRVGRLSSELQLQQLLAVLREIGEQIIDIESEYSVYDSNLDLDAGWLSHR